MGPNTAPADDEKDLELDKKKDKNKEEVENSGEEDEEGSLDKLNSKNKSNDKQQETYFKTGPEKATNMEANMVPPSDRVSGLRKHVEKFHAIRAIESKRMEKLELENVEKTNMEKNVEDLKNDETEEDDTKNSAARNNMEEEDGDEDTKDDMKVPMMMSLPTPRRKMPIWLAVTVKAVIHWILILLCLPNPCWLTFLRVSIL